MIVETEEHYHLQKLAGNGWINVKCLPCQRNSMVLLDLLPVYEKKCIIACSNCETPFLVYGKYEGSDSE